MLNPLRLILAVCFCLVSCQSPDSGDAQLQVDFGGELAAELIDVLLADESLEIVAIDPDWPTTESKKDPASLHGYAVRGRAQLMDRQLRQELLQALAQGARENDGMSAACFNPRHVIIAESNGKTCELIICFECLACQVWDGNVRVTQIDISETPRATFDRIFTDAGLSIAPR